MQISENRYKHGKRIALFLFAVVYMLCCMIPASVLAEGAMIGGGKAVIGQADGTGYGVKFYNADNGLQTDDANVVMLSSDGFIWIGGSGGLIRYDGTDFERQDPSGGITGVNTVFEDSKGYLWVGTNDNGVVCLHNDRSEHYYYKNGLNSSSVNAIAEDGSGNIIIGTKLGLYVIDEDRNISMIDAPELKNSYIRQLVTDSYGYTVGVTSSGALFRLFGLRLTDHYTGDDIGASDISTVLPVKGSKDEVYFGNGSGILCRGSFADKFDSLERIPVAYDRLIPDDSNGGWTDWEDDDSSSEDDNGPEQTELYEHVLVNEPINHLCYAADKIWILMNSHIFYYGGEKFIPLDNVPLNSSVENMAEDFEGNLWFAAKRQGVMKVTANRFMDLNAKAGIEARNVNAVCIRDGLIYIGTDTGLQLVNSSYTPVDNMLTSVLPDVNIRCLTVDSNNTIWASTFTNESGIIGLTEEGVILFFTEDDGLPGNKIYCAAMAPDGSLLAATDNGLAVIKDGKVKRVINADNGLKNPIILTAEADEVGKYFLGSDGDGLYVVDGSSITHFSRDEGLTSDVVMRVKNDKQRGIVWIITSNSIQYYKDGEIRTVEGFPYTGNYDIYFDKHGNAWVLSANGIYVASADDMLSKSRYDYSFYNSSDGLHSLPTPNSYSYLDSNGDLYISGRSGVSVINIDSDQTQDQDIRFKVSYISDGNNKYYPDENNTFTLPSSADNITVYCSALTYSLHDSQIQYYMEGFDDKPVTVNKSEMGPVRYTNLSGGEYEYQMSVIDGRTHNAKNTVGFKIIKQRSFYEHWAFFVLCGAFVLLMMVFIVWLIIRKKNEKLRKQEEEQKKIQRLFEQTATALVNAIDAKDKYTHGHSSRVAEYSRKLAEMLGKDEQECNEVYYAGLLHDVGKIGVPENIINKDGRLTDEEFEKIKQHPDMGAQILQSIDEYPYLSLGARYHHERYDGRGYPHKLKGTDIPEFARIISVADSYDAMTSKRSYRDPIPQQKVREEFVKGMGSQFDPEYARLMLHLIDLDTEYTMKEREVIKEFSGRSELVIDKFKSTVSDGIPVTPQMTTIHFRISPKTGSGAPPVPTLVLFDSLDGRVHSDEKKIKDLLYFEYAEIRLDGKTVVKGARKIVTDQQAKASGDVKPTGHYTLEAVKVKDHVQIKIYSRGSVTEVIAALPDSSRFAYIGITGENCRISDVRIDKAEELTPADKIRRIVEEISYIDVPAGDIPNVQIDGYRTASSEGIPVTDGMKIRFHSKSLPTSRLVWHCPYIDIFTSDDGKVNGENYIDCSFMRIDGECWQNDDVCKVELVVNKNDDFRGWDNWKKLNRDGLECTVTFEKQGNTVTVITENGGILIRVSTELFDAADKTVYAALTGDQCAITNIRIINKD